MPFVSSFIPLLHLYLVSAFDSRSYSFGFSLSFPLCFPFPFCVINLNRIHNEQNTKPVRTDNDKNSVKTDGIIGNIKPVRNNEND